MVVLEVVIRSDGRVDPDRVRVLQGLGYGLHEAAIQTVVKGWKFQPAVLHGKPVDFQAKIEVSFRLLGNPDSRSIKLPFPVRHNNILLSKGRHAVAVEQDGERFTLRFVDKAITVAGRAVDPSNADKQALPTRGGNRLRVLEIGPGKVVVSYALKLDTGAYHYVEFRPGSE